MTKSADELVQNVLSVLGVIDPLEQIGTEDNETVSNQYETSLEVLRDDGLVYWDADSIPNVVFDALSQYMAYHVAPKYGTPQSQLILIKDGRQMSWEDAALKSLRKHMAKRGSSETVRAQYF